MATNTFRVGGALEINDNGASNYTVTLAPTAPLTANRSVTFPNANCDLQYAAQMNQSVATGASPTFVNPTMQQPLVKLGIDLEDPGAIGTKKVTLNASEGMGSDYTVTMPAAVGAKDNIMSVSSVAGGVATMGFVNNVPADTMDISGFVSWGAFSGGAGVYWTYDKPTVSFTLTCAGYGYIRGKRVEWLAPQTRLCAVNEVNYLYIDGSGVLQRSGSDTTPDGNLYINDIPLFELLDDGVIAEPFVKKENHPVQFNTTISEFFHHNLGNIIRGPGAILTKLTAVSPGTGTNIEDRQFWISGEDVNEDHGLTTTIPNGSNVVAQIASYFYANNAGKWFMEGGAPTTLPPLKYDSGNGTDTLTPGYRGIIRMYVTEDSLNTTTPQFVGVLHTAQFQNLSQANSVISAGTAASPTNELAAMELTQLGYLVVRNQGANGYIEQITIQKNTFNARFVGGASSSSHLTLTDLTGGQYSDGGHSLLTQRSEAAAAPAIDSDSRFYRVGSIWVDKTNTLTVDSYNTDIYLCSDTTLSHAVWHGLGWWTSNIPERRKGAVVSGYQALLYGPTAQYNIALGYQALIGKSDAPMTGTDNYAIGRLAIGCTGAGTHSGTYNTAFGYSALSALTTGSKNHCCGYQAGNTITTGSSNIAIGDDSDCAATLSYQIAIGQGAITGGTDTICIGYGATCGAATDSIFVGTSAGLGTATGTGSVGIGYNALHALIGGGYNIGLGYNAGNSITTGTNNIAIGKDSDGAAAVSDQIAIGTSATTTTTGSVAIGTSTTASGANDSLAMMKNAQTLGGNGSIAIGPYTQANGHATVAIGGDTGAATNGARATANYAVSIGGSTRAAGLYSICAGYSDYTSGQNNTFIGYNNGGGLSADVPVSTGSNNVIIGSGNVTSMDTGYENVFIGYSNGNGVINTAFTTGNRVVTIGYLNVVKKAANNSVAIGAGNEIGDIAFGVAIGTGCYSSGTSGVAIGTSVGCAAAGSFVVGRNTYCPVGNDDKLWIGKSNTDGQFSYINYGGTSWANSSDERLKNIIGVVPVGLNFINKLVPIEFTYKADTSNTIRHGFGAQTMKAAMDELGLSSFEGYMESASGMLGVAPGALVPFIVRACQELSAENAALAADLAAAKTRLAAAESEIAAIKAHIGM